MAGNKLGAAYSFPGLQKKRGVSYDPERDLPAIRLFAAFELVELSPSASEQLVETTPPTKPEVTIDQPSIFEKLKLLINATVADYPSMPELVAKLYSTGVRVKVEFSTQGLATGISYELDGISTNGSNLGKEYSFEGLQKHLGVDYNPEWDNRLIETIVNYGFEGRKINDTYIEQLTRFRQIKQLEAQRMKQVFQVLGIEVEEQLPVAIRLKPLQRIALDNDEKAVKSADSALSVEAQPDNYVAVTKDDIIPTISNGSDDSVSDNDILKENAATENDLLQTSISQEYTNKTAATIRLLWQRQGQPNQISGQHYDLELALETLQVMRKSGEQIASISLKELGDTSFQGFTQEDWDRFDKIDAVLLAEHLREVLGAVADVKRASRKARVREDSRDQTLQQRQQRHQSGIELD